MKYRKSINETNREFQKIQSGREDENPYQNRKRMQEHDRKRPIRNYVRAWEDYKNEADDIEDFFGK